MPEIARKEVKKSKGRVEIVYYDDEDKIVAHESLDAETYKKNYPQEERIES